MPEVLPTRARRRPPVSALILAGGASRRMGRNKAWLELEGHTLLGLAIEKVRAAGCAEVMISGRGDADYSTFGCPVLYDLEPGFGPVAGIERGLHACATPLLLVLAVDLPQMTVDFLKRLRRRCNALTGAVPWRAGDFEPLAAIYPKRCHALAFDALIRGRHSARDFAVACRRERAVRILRVTTETAPCFINWNHPADCRPAGSAPLVR
jgi:molybdopterin-guanine dinucleotide biosynthesis protein A